MTKGKPASLSSDLLVRKGQAAPTPLRPGVAEALGTPPVAADKPPPAGEGLVGPSNGRSMAQVFAELEVPGEAAAGSVPPAQPAAAPVPPAPRPESPAPDHRPPPPARPAGTDPGPSAATAGPPTARALPADEASLDIPSKTAEKAETAAETRPRAALRRWRLGLYAGLGATAVLALALVWLAGDRAADQAGEAPSAAAPPAAARIAAAPVTPAGTEGAATPSVATEPVRPEPAVMAANAPAKPPAEPAPPPVARRPAPPPPLVTARSDAAPAPPPRPPATVGTGNEAAPTRVKPPPEGAVRTAAAKTRPAPSAAPPTRPGGNAYVIQLVSLRSAAAAERERVRLQEKFPDVLGGHALTVQRAVLAKGVHYRVRAGGFGDKAAARAACARLEARKQACLVIRP